MSEGKKDKAPNGPIVPVQVPSVRKASVRGRNGPKASVLASNDLRLRNVPLGSLRVPSVLGLHGRRLRNGPMLPARVLSGPWTGVRLPASSNGQPARASVCASALAVRS